MASETREEAARRAAEQHRLTQLRAAGLGSPVGPPSDATNLERAQLLLTKLQDDEPVFILRAKDVLSVLAVMHYITLLEGYNPVGAKVESATNLLNEFRAWQQTHPHLVRLPD